MNGLKDFRNFSSALKDSEELPVLFIGHGSPMNGIELNEFSRTWIDLSQKINQPQAVLVISAHWFTAGTKITAMNTPTTIHDFGGFPQQLFDVQYPASGAPELAQEIQHRLAAYPIELNHDWGLDHGAWTVLRRMYPQANIPILQLSIDYKKGAAYHYELAKELAFLRKKGVLIIGSGNMVHNLRMINWQMMDGGGYDWALEANDIFKEKLLNHEHQSLINTEKLGDMMRLAIPTPEHYLPLIYTIALQNEKDSVSFFNDKAVGGSLTMTSVQIGN